MATATGLALRDDASSRSLSTNEKVFLRSCALSFSSSGSAPVRADGRHPTEARPLRLTLSRSHGAAECVVRLGSQTRVMASVSCGLIPPPNVDRPNDGQVRFSVDLSPMSCVSCIGGGPVYSAGIAGAGGRGGAPPTDDAQRLLTNRILRTLERTLLAGGAIDSEALCVQSGRWVWRLSVDIVCLDHGANLIDGALLAAVAALRYFRKPEVQISSDSEGGSIGSPVVLNSDEREPSPLPLHHTPLSVTFALFSDREITEGTGTVAALIDPTEREELVADGMATLSFNKYGELCGLDFPGGTELRPSQLVQCAKLGEQRCVEWCSFLEDALTEAEIKDAKEKMSRLKAANTNSDDLNNAMLPPEISNDVPFVERTEPERDGDMMDVSSENLVAIASDKARAAEAQAAAEEEERYRLRALDYSLGHIAAKVKEDDVKSRQKGGKASSSTSSLMNAMLKSVKSRRDATDIGGTKEDTKVVAPNKRDIETVEAVGEETSTASVVHIPKKNAKSTHTAQSIAQSTKLRESLDSDDEEEVTVLHSEFAVPKGPASPPPDSATTEAKTKKGVADDDDSVDDLAMAVVKKKKGKKSKKKK